MSLFSKLPQPVEPDVLLTRARKFMWPFISFVVLAATMKIHTSSMPPKIEESVRLLAMALGLAAVPVLLATASRAWLTQDRAHLPAWRNGFGLSAIVVTFLRWLLYWGIGFLLWAKLASPLFLDGLEVFAILLCSSLVGCVLGLSLRGIPRAQIISAALLMCARLEAGIYV